MAGCTSDERCWRVLRPPPSFDDSKTSPQEIHQRQQHMDKVQCWTAQKQGHTSSFPDQPFQQFPVVTSDDRRRWNEHWNTMCTLQALVRHMWRGPWQEDITRNGSLPTPSTSWKQGERGKLCYATAEQEQLRQRHRNSTQQWAEKQTGALRRIRGTTSMT